MREDENKLKNFKPYENILKNFKPYENKKFILEKQDIKRNNCNLEGKSLDTRICAKNGFSGYILQAGLLKNKLLSFFKDVKFSDQEFLINISISNI